MVIVYLLACYGITFGLMQDKIPFIPKMLNRVIPGMLDCAYCTGFHAGWLVALFFLPLHLIPVMAFASSAFCYTLDVTLSRIEG